MIIVKLIGGLGNQLFQYAAARSLANRKNTKLCIDATGFDKASKDIKRNYELDLFNIDASFASAEQVRKITRPSVISRGFNKLRPYYRKNYYREQYAHFDPNFFKASSSTLLEGYWQSERYFKEIRNIILDEFRITAPLSSSTVDLASRISNSNSVSLHVRRGDYISNPETFKFHGICEPEYYGKALELLAGKAGPIEIFVFSDEIEWAKKNILTRSPITFVDHNDSGHAYEDLYLMSLCRHNIIANSSFSWWGAWLNKNPGKIVVAPSKWFGEANIDTKDLIPQEWLKV